MPRTTWVGRWVRGWRLDRNPLRRGSDRGEAALIGLLVAAFAVGTPVVAHDASSWTYSYAARAAQVQQASERHVPAVLLGPAFSWSVYDHAVWTSPSAQARWKAPDGHELTGLVPVAAHARKGSVVTIATDQAGQLIVPLPPYQVSERAGMAEGLAVLALALALIVTGWLARWGLNRRRLAAWDAEWLATGPRWSTRR